MKTFKHVGVSLLSSFFILAIVSGILFLSCAKKQVQKETGAPAPAPPPVGTGTAPLPPIPSFPWPPPRPSAEALVPDQFLRNAVSERVYLRDIDMRISSALEKAGYFQKSYFLVLNGFALVTHLEQINEDGTPKLGSQRWIAEVGPLREFSLAAYLRALFTSNAGYFRVIVFIVTNQPFNQTGVPIGRDQALAWIDKGSSILPSEIGASVYTAEHYCKALIYEFEKSPYEQEAEQISLGLQGREHLQRSQIWNGLER